MLRLAVLQVTMILMMRCLLINSVARYSSYNTNKTTQSKTVEGSSKNSTTVHLGHFYQFYKGQHLLTCVGKGLSDHHNEIKA